MKITEIKPNDRNPRYIKDAKFEKLCNSITEFPQMMALRPIVVDNDGVILGGNMRFRALKKLGWTDIPDEWVKRAEDLTEEQKRRFIVEDNVGFGEWDFDLLANEWNDVPLYDWGVDIPTGVVMDSDDFGEEFSLASGDKSPFQQMTFTLANEQADEIKKALERAKKSDGYKYCETFGNENTNGNALYLIVKEWAK